LGRFICFCAALIRSTTAGTSAARSSKRLRNGKRRLGRPNAFRTASASRQLTENALAANDFRSQRRADQVGATALVERVVHHADIVRIDGESYRLRESQQNANSRSASRREKNPKTDT
jgi:hypothetical protein